MLGSLSNRERAAIFAFGGGALVLFLVFAAGALMGRFASPVGAPQESAASPAEPVRLETERFLVEAGVFDTAAAGEETLLQLRRQYTSAWGATDPDDRRYPDDRDYPGSRGRGNKNGHYKNGKAYRTLVVPRAYYPRSGACRVWLTGRATRYQPQATSCNRLYGRVPAGAFILYNGNAWDADYDWYGYERRYPRSVPRVIVEITSYRRR